MSKIAERLWHRFLRVPYTLHVYRQSMVSKPRATLVFLHGLGNAGATWERVADKLPDDIDFVIVDLLGFGDSPSPTWAVYNARTQAQALAKTLLTLGLRQKVILVGHSMGSLVAVEFAKRYPLVVDSLVLCSPPLYKVRGDGGVKRLRLERDELLRGLYELATKDPANVVRVARVTALMGLKTPEFDIDKLNTDTYVAALRSSIINQTTMFDIVELKKPVSIIYGTLDPFVIGSNIKRVQEVSEYVQVTKFIGGHEIIGSYVDRVADVIDKRLEPDTV